MEKGTYKRKLEAQEAAWLRQLWGQNSGTGGRGQHALLCCSQDGGWRANGQVSAGRRAACRGWPPPARQQGVWRRGGAEPGEREEVPDVKRPWIPWKWGGCRSRREGQRCLQRVSSWISFRFCGPGAAPGCK